MREILFRGKRVDNGEWVQGYLFQHWGKSYILWGMADDIPNMTEVIPETVGQYTGMQDRNGKKIFEGDRIAFVDFLNGWETECIGEVIFSEFGWHFTDSITESNMHCYESEHVEIIGNIHESED